MFIQKDKSSNDCRNYYVVSFILITFLFGFVSYIAYSATNKLYNNNWIYVVMISLLWFIPGITIIIYQIYKSLYFVNVTIYFLKKDFTIECSSKIKINLDDPVFLIALIDNPENYQISIRDKSTKTYRPIKCDNSVITLIHKFKTNNFFAYPLKYILPVNV